MKVVVSALIATLFVAGCGSGDEGGGSPEPQSALPAEVTSLADGTRVIVSGFLFIEDDTRLCGAILESYPPQCAVGDSVVLADLDPGSVVGLSSPNDPAFAPVIWTDFPLTVIGVVDGASLTEVSVSHEIFSGESGAVVTRVMPVSMPGGIVFAMDVTNTGSDPIEATFPDGQTAEVILRDGDTEVYRWSDGKAFDMAIRTIELPAGGSMSAVLNDEPVEIAGLRIEAWFVAETLEGAVAAGTIGDAG